MVSPADADRVLTYMRHESIFETEPRIDAENILRIMRHESMIFEPQPTIDVENIMRIMRHESMIFKPEPSIDVDKIMKAVRKVSSFEENLDKPVDAAFYQSSAKGDSLADSVDEYECDEHSSGHCYSDIEGDSCWDLECEDENKAPDEISSQEPDSSPYSGEEASVENAVEDVLDSDSIGSPEGNYECSACGALHLKPSLLKQHRVTRSDDRLFMCPVENCDREYKSLEHLRRHSLTHEGNLFVCAWGDCDQTFNDNCDLRRHLKIHEKWGVDHLGGTMNPDACLSCSEPGCGKTFRYRSLLNFHIDNVHDAHGMPDMGKFGTGLSQFQWLSRPGRWKRVKLHHDDDLLLPNRDRSQPDLE